MGRFVKHDESDVNDDLVTLLFLLLEKYLFLLIYY